MKKYETPFVEKITFDYTAQIVTSSTCQAQVTNVLENGVCVDGTHVEQWVTPQPSGF